MPLKVLKAQGSRESGKVQWQDMSTGPMHLSILILGECWVPLHVVTCSTTGPTGRTIEDGFGLVML